MADKTWLSDFTNTQQLLIQMGAIGFSWLVMAALMWAGWTMLQDQINYLHQELEQARQERHTDHKNIYDAIRGLKQ